MSEGEGGRKYRQKASRAPECAALWLRTFWPCWKYRQGQDGEQREQRSHQLAMGLHQICVGGDTGQIWETQCRLKQSYLPPDWVYKRKDIF